jgi:hypothetical protein
MSKEQKQSSNRDSQSQQNQSTQQSSASEGQKRSAPEHPPATPMHERSNSANFSEDSDKDTAKF